MTDVKICGLKHPSDLETAARGGARYAGIVFHPPSPRHLGPEQAGALIRAAPSSIVSVGLFVDADDAFIAAMLAAAPVSMIQLHGRETPQRVAAIRARFGRPVIKAIPVAVPADLDAVDDYAQVSDWILFDAKPDPSAHLPGGNGVAFDWSILKARVFPRPWMLSGGLTPGNVGSALSILSPAAVDVSSGVESAPGQKDPERIISFLDAVAAARVRTSP